MKNFKKILLIFTVTFVVSCSIDTTETENPNDLQNVEIKNSESSKYSFETKDIRRQLIEYQAELGRCYGNPAYGAPIYPEEVEIESPADYTIFQSQITQQLITTFSGFPNQIQFVVPIFNFIPTPYMLFQLRDQYSQEACYIAYLDAIEAYRDQLYPPM